MVTSENQFYFRNGIKELFQLIEKYHIPLYIVSGGIKEVIQSSLKYVIQNFNSLVQKGLIHIVSNEFTYNSETDEIETYKEPMIYTFNKSIVFL
jgi:2-hydroxy-3-keto-5-methylthiopentenyl-1-phosphate phosphatase